MLANALPTNAVDPMLLFDIARIGIWILATIIGLACAAAAWRNATKINPRAPSVDVELAAIQQRLANVENRLRDDIESINGKLESGAVLHRELQANQAINGERLADVQASVHSLSQRLNALPEQLSSVILAAQNKRR